ncbi:uncharacterized protein LOC126657258 [Mercurialis annua]|uniref:uncharacterized protein LOC126657258 n=1 Tax=Mercurialis annua TaxID=3986 RepID=UPI002160EBE8|nr:uncharacterized protein LOC126657258 [Mercurialis annua]
MSKLFMKPLKKSIVDRFPNISITDADISKSASVKDLWKNNQWAFSDPIDEATQEMWNQIKNNYCVTPGNIDSITWKAQSNGLFTIKSLWRNLNVSRCKVPWYKIIWFSGNIPRHSFTTWLALNNRLNTKDKLVTWKVIPTNICSLCNQYPEDVNHLFFSCKFSYEIWNCVLKDMGKRRLFLCATVYQIWLAKNGVIFNQKVANSDQVFGCIKADAAVVANYHLVLLPVF